MNDTRARFEEIWPVPAGVWFEGDSYRAGWDENKWRLAADCNLRLDTFTHCQETTAIHLSLIDDLVNELEWSYSFLPRGKTYSTDTLDRAKQIMEKGK